MARYPAIKQLKALVTPQMRVEQLAESLGVDRQTVYGWLSGRFKPSDDSRAALERLHGIDSRGWLLADDESAEPGSEGAA